MWSETRRGGPMIKEFSHNTDNIHIFIGSSSHHRKIVDKLEEKLTEKLKIPRNHIKNWTRGVFEPGSGTFYTLVSILADIDFAILLFTGDDLKKEETGISKFSPRSNVVFELGLYVGGLGRKRTFLLYDENNQPEIPSDLAGITRVHVKLHNSEQVIDSTLEEASDKIISQIRKLGMRRLKEGIYKIKEHEQEIQNYQCNSEYFSRINVIVENCSTKLQPLLAANPSCATQMLDVIEWAVVKGVYTVLGAAEVYRHDAEVIRRLPKGSSYRATHPFSSNPRETSPAETSFQIYLKEQKEAINRGVSIQRIYIVDDINTITDKQFKELEDLYNAGISVYLAISKNAKPPYGVSQDFVLIGSSCLGKSIPDKGPLIGSKYYLNTEEERLNEYKEHERFFSELMAVSKEFKVVCKEFTAVSKEFNTDTVLGGI